MPSTLAGFEQWRGERERTRFRGRYGIVLIGFLFRSTNLGFLLDVNPLRRILVVERVNLVDLQQGPVSQRWDQTRQSRFASYLGESRIHKRFGESKKNSMQIDDEAVRRHGVWIDAKSCSLDVGCIDVAEVRKHFLPRSRSSADDVVQDAEEDVLIESRVRKMSAKTQ